MTHVVTLLPPLNGLPQSVQVESDAVSGGEGEVYFSTDGRHAVKAFYHANPNLEQHLRYIMALFADLPEDQKRFIVPPLALIETFDGTPRPGFIMRRVPPRYRKAVDLILTPRQAAEQFARGITWGSYLLAARSMAHAIGVLHSKGCAHTDIHYENFVVDIDEGDAVMMEADGVVVSGFIKPRVKGLVGFMAPEILTKGAVPSKITDRHSLAVLVLHMLLFRNPLQPLIELSDDQAESVRLGWGEQALFSDDPQDRRNRPTYLDVPLFEGGVLGYRMLSPQLRHVTEGALIAGLHDPPRRPSVHDWLEALSATLDQLWGCNECQQVFPYPYWKSPPMRACPFCGEQTRPPRPVVLSMWEERLAGSFAPIDRALVLGNGSPIYADMAEPHCLPPRTRRGVPIIGHTVWDEKRRAYRLVNNSDCTWTTVQSTATPAKVGGNQSIDLQPKTMIRLGSGKRILEVIDGGG
ncbi:hypothetical protein ACQEVF_56900 [Nonomuraea polychroma]|uniref:hypothetical protein n=1 Tax=Nonomuraea polychroma TaxID=46176 RepID=UPI003D8A30F8